MAGRPKIYETVEELEKAIQHYFDSITITKPAFDICLDGKDGEGNDIFKKKPRMNNAGEQVMVTSYYENPSVLAMCRHIGMTRETLSQYEKQEQFSDTIKSAKARVEEYLENQLYRKDQVTGIIFN